MRNLHELDKYRVKHPTWPQNEKNGVFKVYVNGRSFYVLVSVDTIGGDGMWEHISVTPKNQKRCPTWEEMCAIKDMFFFPEEECIEYHPRRSEYVNYESNCLHIWRPVNGSVIRRPIEDVSGMDTLAERDARLEAAWADFTDVPMDPDTEKMEERFLHFPTGTPREEIWHWFDERYSKGVAHLLYSDGEDRTLETARLCYLKLLCTECDSETCIFNPEGVCMAPFVTGQSPALSDDGCGDWVGKED